MIEVDFKLVGTEAIVANLNGLAPRIREEVREAIFNLGVEAEGMMRGLAPVLSDAAAKKNRNAVSGTLVRSIVHRFVEYPDGNVFSYTAPHGGKGATADAYYAKWVERGVDASEVRAHRRGYRDLFKKERQQFFSRRTGRYFSRRVWGKESYSDKTYDLRIPSHPFVEPTRQAMQSKFESVMRAVLERSLGGD